MNIAKNLSYDKETHTITGDFTKELDENEFFCNKCKTIHKKSAYAIAQYSMRVDLIFSCDCGNKIELFCEEEY